MEDSGHSGCESLACEKPLVEALLPLFPQVSSCATIWDPLGLISPSHSSHSNALVCALTLSQPAMATKPDSACSACTSLTTSNGNSRRAHLFPTASTSAVCYSACFLDNPLPVRLSPQTPGNTTACQQSPSNTPSRTDGLPVPPHRLATGCGLLGASIS